MCGTLWLLLQAGYLHDTGVSYQVFLLAVLTVGVAVLQPHYFPCAWVCKIIGVTDSPEYFPWQSFTGVLGLDQFSLTS